MSEPDRRTSAFVTGASVPENYQRRLAPVIFEPWAEALLEAAPVAPGGRVLDVASGTGVVARLAARRAGPSGRVVASDVSAPMLEFAASIPDAEGSAPIERVVAPATELPGEEGAFDVVLCQQGLPFFTDRPGAAREMRRVLRPGGAAAVSVWAAGRRLEPFDDYAGALQDAELTEPFPNAFENASFVMSAEDVEALLRGAGFAHVEVAERVLVLEWPDTEAATAGILGTPFGPVVQSLAPEQRRAVEEQLRRRFEAEGPVRRTSVAVIGVGA